MDWTSAIAGGLAVFAVTVLLRWRSHDPWPKVLVISAAYGAIWTIVWLLIPMAEARFGTGALLGLIPAAIGLVVVIAIIDRGWRSRPRI